MAFICVAGYLFYTENMFLEKDSFIRLQLNRRTLYEWPNTHDAGLVWYKKNSLEIIMGGKNER